MTSKGAALSSPIAHSLKDDEFHKLINEDEPFA
jgi:hypothetical protein